MTVAVGAGTVERTFASFAEHEAPDASAVAAAPMASGLATAPGLAVVPPRLVRGAGAYRGRGEDPECSPDGEADAGGDVFAGDQPGRDAHRDRGRGAEGGRFL